MKQIPKNFSIKGIDNLIVKYPEIKIEERVEDKPRRVQNFHYCKSFPKIRKHPQIAALSKNTLELIGYDYEDVQSDPNSPLYLSGSQIIPGSIPVAHNYCGIQFGVWAGQLGDGRAHTLGTVSNKGNIYELQLKGSGMSPFSRHADGNSVVSSAVREFLASQLMFGLDIPTTRAASLVIAEEDVVRDPYYNGQIKKEKAAIVLRVSPSFLRIGSFQVCNKNAQMDTGDMMGNRKILLPLANYLHTNFYSHLDEEECDVYEAMFEQIVKANAQLVAHWQAKGFVHGVLNTDNISMLGLTIDYGPFGFMDYFSKDYVSNATDQYERYSYRQQPTVMKWNLSRLADSFDYLVPKSILNKYIENNFMKIYEKVYYSLMGKKLGLSHNKETENLIDQLLEIMHICGSNFTNTFRIINRIFETTKLDDIVQELLAESLPTPYYLKNIRVFPQLKQVPQSEIQNIRQHDQSFNINFIIEQAKRLELKKILMSQTCEDRTAREKQLWSHWVSKYQKMEIDHQTRDKNTIKYTLLNETAKNITEQLVKLKPNEQREFMNQLQKVFETPYQMDEWFEKKFWSNRPIPIRLTCSS